MKSFSRLKKNLKNDFSKLKPVRVALLGDTATQFLSIAIRGAGFDEGLDLQIWEADFNQIERQVFDHSSELYEFNPGVILLFHSSHQLLQKYNRLKPDEYINLAQKQLELVDSLCAAINGKLSAKIIYYNYPEINDGVFGSYGAQITSSFIFQLRKLNYELTLFAAKHPGFYLCDLSSIQNQTGKATFFQPAMYINAEMVLSIDILPQVAVATVAMMGTFYGRINKCLIFDLDNTIWGGIIGDDGMENIQLGSLGIGKAFTELQYWIKKLKNRGVILAVCSRNTASVAMQPFKQHPDMVLRPEDIAVFVANWDNKVDNIRQIQSTLNIGFDAMVFLDDNPFERGIVKEHIPELIVPELPEDPADYLEYLYTLNLFEITSVTVEDADRTKQYRTHAKRNTAQQGYVNVDAFLQSLNMRSSVEPFNEFNAPRVAQLSQRSNQFNLRTVRYTEADIKVLIKQDGVFTYSFTLADRFGDNGLISIVILKKEDRDTLFIDTWLMSCRVLKRGMENFILNTIAGVANEKGYQWLKGEYLPTARNGMVKDHYRDLNFRQKDNFWMLQTGAYQPEKTHIKKHE